MRRRNQKVVPDGVPEASEWVIASSGVRLRIRTYKSEVSQNSQSSDNASALFLIHGVAGSSDIWHHQVDCFTKAGYDVIAPDLVGHGFSGAPENPKHYTFDSLSADVLDVFDHYKKDINIVVGHSYGTSFAAYLARLRSDDVYRLVLLSGGAPVSLAPQPGLLSLPASLLSCFRPVLAKLFYSKAFDKKSKNLRNKEAAFDVPLYVLRNIIKGQIWTVGDVTFHRHITQPVLLLHGENDQLEDVENTAVMHEVLPNSEFHVIKDCGHMIMMEQPQVLNDLIIKFLRPRSAVPRTPTADRCHTDQIYSPALSSLPCTPRHHKSEPHAATKSQPDFTRSHH